MSKKKASFGSNQSFSLYLIGKREIIFCFFLNVLSKVLTLNEIYILLTIAEIQGIDLYKKK